MVFGKTGQNKFGRSGEEQTDIVLYIYVLFYTFYTKNLMKIEI